MHRSAADVILSEKVAMVAPTADNNCFILSLPNDALARIFSHLASPPVDDEILLYPPSALILSNNPDSPAASFGQSCRRLHILYHRAVRLFRVHHICACGAPPSLAAFPFADAAVLDETLVALPICADPQSLFRLRVLCVSSFPSEAYGAALAAAVPNLLELSLGCLRWFSLRKNHRHSDLPFEPKPLISDLQKGLQPFILHLPLSLRRLSAVGLFGEAQLTGFWTSVGLLDQLEDLNVWLFNIDRDEVDAFTYVMKCAIQNCHQLRRFSVKSSRLHFGTLFPVLPARLTSLVISSGRTAVADFLYVNTPPPSQETIAQGLQTLQLNSGWPCLQNWALLRPVACQLRKIHVHRISGRTTTLLDADYVMPFFPRLEELHLLGRNSDLSWGLPEEVLWKLLASADVLQDLRIRIGEDPSSLTGKGLARALSVAASGLTLKRLKLDLIARLKMPEQFDSAASVIAEKFSGLEEIDLSNTLVTPFCLATIGQGCSLLSRLKLGAENRRTMERKSGYGEREAGNVEHLASEIGSHFSQLKALVLSGSNITSKGLVEIGRGCLLLRDLSLACCVEIDDAAVVVLWNCFPVLSKLDLCETPVSEIGLKMIGGLWQQSFERSPLEIVVRTHKKRCSFVNESLVSQLSGQFPRLNFVLSCKPAAAVEYFT